MSSREKALSRRNEDTFASFSRPSASYRPSSVILRTCKNVCDAKNIFVLRAIHFSIGHFPFVGIFVLKAASSRMSAISVSLTLGISISDQLQH
jgi:hypothetical protein